MASRGDADRWTDFNWIDPVTKPYRESTFRDTTFADAQLLYSIALDQGLLTEEDVVVLPYKLTPLGGEMLVSVELHPVKLNLTDINHPPHPMETAVLRALKQFGSDRGFIRVNAFEWLVKCFHDLDVDTDRARACSYWTDERWKEICAVANKYHVVPAVLLACSFLKAMKVVWLFVMSERNYIDGRFEFSFEEVVNVVNAIGFTGDRDVVTEHHVTYDAAIQNFANSRSSR